MSIPRLDFDLSQEGDLEGFLNSKIGANLQMFAYKTGLFKAVLCYSRSETQINLIRHTLKLANSN